MSDDTVVRTVGLAKSYGDRPVLNGVDLEVDGGTVFALLGPNGAGKTTTVRILSTLLKPDAGTVTVRGLDVLRFQRQVRHLISVTGQNTAIDELLTGEENLLMMGRLRHLERAEARARVNELLNRFDLTGDAKRQVKTYSGGMRRKLDLAMSLISRPLVLFLDEPTTGLDPRSRQAVWDVLADLVADGMTIFLTTQYLEEADRLADRIAVIDMGRVIATGTADELKSRVGSEQVELLLDDPATFGWTVSTLGAAVVRTDPTRRSVWVATDGTAAHVKHVLDRLELEGIGVESLALHRPTLDDVFLTLTGRPAEHDVEREKEMSLS
jgi:ABC-2 type transport system ATP-binding protein